MRIPPKILKTNNETKATLDKQTICLNNHWDKMENKTVIVDYSTNITVSHFNTGILPKLAQRQIHRL